MCCADAVSCVNYLQSPMRDALIAPGSRSSHTVRCDDLRIEGWELSRAELARISEYVQQKLGSASCRRVQAVPLRPVRSALRVQAIAEPKVEQIAKGPKQWGPTR